MTVGESLLDSCGTIFMRQGISLHYQAQSNPVIYQKLEKKQGNFFCYSINIGHQSDYIHL